MTTYLTIITTLLVVTQIIRTIQNAIDLHRAKKKFDSTLGWLNERYIGEEDFETQRECYSLLRDWLIAQKNSNSSCCCKNKCEEEITDAYKVFEQNS